jgi:hypothetical protein
VFKHLIKCSVSQYSFRLDLQVYVMPSDRPDCYDFDVSETPPTGIVAADAPPVNGTEAYSKRFYYAGTTPQDV